MTSTLLLLAQSTQPLPPPIPSGTFAERLQSPLGLVVFLAIAFAIGRFRGHKKLPHPRTFAWGLILQFLFGAIVVWNRAFLVAINDVVDALLGFTAQGADDSGQSGGEGSDP